MAIMTEAPRYISIEDVAREFGVVRGTVYYWMRAMKIKTKKFPLDKRTYISRGDMERLRAAYQAGKEGKH